MNDITTPRLRNVKQNYLGRLTQSTNAMKEPDVSDQKPKYSRCGVNRHNANYIPEKYFMNLEVVVVARLFKNLYL